MRLYFARHGESEANVLRVVSNRGYQHPLTALGREQAQALANSMHHISLTAIYTSPLQRAVETAQIVAESKGLDYEITDALREYDCGILEGHDDADTWAAHEQIWRDWLVHGKLDLCPQDGENFTDIRARFVPFIDGLLEEYGGESVNIFLMGHGGLYRAMLPLVFNNIDNAYTLSNPILNACTIVGEHGSAGLRCIEWCGVGII